MAAPTDAAGSTKLGTPERARGLEGCAAAGTRATLARWAIADFLFAAWLAWMTPLLAALSSWRDALLQRGEGAVLVAGVGRLAEPAHRRLQRRLTLLLRSRAFSLVRMRLIWDLMFATKEPQRWYGQVIAHSAGMRCRARSSRPRGGQPRQLTSARHDCPTSEQSSVLARLGGLGNPTSRS